MEGNGDIKKIFKKLLSCFWKKDLRRANSLVKNLNLEDRKAVSRIRDDDEDGSTLLFTAASFGDTSSVNFLLDECGADTEQQCACDSNRVRMTPLCIAAYEEYLDVVKTLVQHGADVNDVSEGETTAVQAACIANNINIVRFLVENGADISLPDDIGTTCLMESVCSVKLCNFLIEQHASVNAVDNRGSSALHHAIMGNCLASVKLLTECGADTSICNQDGDDALQTAAFKGIPEIVEYLIEEMNPTSERRADAYSLLASTIMGNSNKEQALSFWIKSANIRMVMEELTEDPNEAVSVSPNSAFNFAVEAKNIDSLMNTAQDDDAMHMQTLVVRERILGPNHPETVKAVILQAARYADLHAYQRWIDLSKYALHKLRLDPTAGRQMHYVLKIVFATLHKNSTENPASIRFAEVSDLLGCVVDKIGEFMSSSAAFPSDLAILPQLAIYLVHLLCDLTLTNAETTRFKQLVRALVQTRLRTEVNGIRVVKNYTLLHLAVDFGQGIYVDSDHDDSDDDDNEDDNDNMNDDDEENDDDDEDDDNDEDDETDNDHDYDDNEDFEEYAVTSYWPTSVVVECLLAARAAVNAVDSDGNTPLHVAEFSRPAATSMREDWEKKTELLLNHGAHVDMANAKGKFVYKKLPANIDVFNHISLQCLAARAIRAHKIPYGEILPKMVAEFVDYH